MLRPDPSAHAALHRTTRDRWVDHGLLAVAFAVLLTGFDSTINGGDWFVTTIMVAVLAGLTCGVLRAIGVRWVAATAIGVELLALTWIFVPSTLFAVLPTPETVRAIAGLVAESQRIIVEEQAPVAAARPVVLLIAASFGLLVIVADALLERPRAAQTIGVLFVAIFATPALISGVTPSVWQFVLVAALWLVLLRSRTRAHVSDGWATRLPALVVAAAALGVSVLLPPALPDVTAVAAGWGKPPPSVFGRGINPILELGQNLRRNSPSVALTYTTTRQTAPYLKVSTLRDLTGKTWKPSTTTGRDPFEGRIGLAPDIKYTEDTTNVAIRGLDSSLLPVPYSALSLRGIDGAWRFERMGMTIRSDSASTKGQTYTVRSLTIAPTAEQMRDLTTVVGPPLQPFVELPEKMPAVIAETARRVTAGATNDYDKALALQTFLRNGDFVYSETAPVADDYDGNGVSVIAQFLKERAGYCVHFSSTMAVMARTLGIPSRIAVGYAPGTVTGVRNGENVYENTSDNLHAWPELYFEGAGWVGFEPTTGVGNATQFEEPASNTPLPDATSDTGTGPNEATGPNQLDAGSPTETAAPSQTGQRSAIVTTVGLLILAAAPGAVRRVRRRWRMRRGVESPDPLWRELEDTAQDFGVGTSVADTPRGFANRLRDRPGVDGEALDRLLRRVETTRCARTSPAAGDGRTDLRAVIDSLHAGSSRRERLRATALPRSLAGRRTYVVPVEPRLAT